MLDGRRDAAARALSDGPKAARLGGRLERPAVAGWAESPGCPSGGRMTRVAGTFLSEHTKNHFQNYFLSHVIKLLTFTMYNRLILWKKP